MSSQRQENANCTFATSLHSRLGCVLSEAEAHSSHSCRGWILGEGISGGPQTFAHGLVDLRAWVDHTLSGAWNGAGRIEIAAILSGMADKWQWLGPALDL